ncbi:MAG: hypothetical protein JWM75_590 [Sphingomonas bacterium]|nr:hypothetical protein [Sphingomonas bacterium]
MDTDIAVRLEHVFDVRVDFTSDRCVFGPLPGGGSQGYTPASGGRIEGPRLSGRVVPHSGADFATVRADGVIELNAHYLLEADDGTKIYITNRGYLVPARPGEAVIAHGMAQPAYFRFTPTFKVPAGPHDWLARTVILGAGERHANPDHSIFRYYAVY